MSPERIHGHEYELPSDIWSVGIVMLECALGREVFPGACSPIDLAQELGGDGGGDALVTTRLAALPRGAARPSAAFERFLRATLAIAPASRAKAAEPTERHEALVADGWFRAALDPEFRGVLEDLDSAMDVLKSFLDRLPQPAAAAADDDDDYDRLGSGSAPAGRAASPLEESLMSVASGTLSRTMESSMMESSMGNTMMGNTMKLGDSDEDDDDAKPWASRRVAPARGGADARAEAKSARGGADEKGGAGACMGTWESDDDDDEKSDDPMNSTVNP